MERYQRLLADMHHIKNSVESFSGNISPIFHVSPRLYNRFDEGEKKRSTNQQEFKVKYHLRRDFNINNIEEDDQSRQKLREKADYLLKLLNLCVKIYRYSEPIMLNHDSFDSAEVKQAACYIAYAVAEDGAELDVHSVAELIDFIAAEKIKVDELSKEASSITRKSWKEELKLGFGLEDSSGIRALHIIPSVMIGGAAAAVFAATILDPGNQSIQELYLVTENIDLRDFFFNHEDFNPLSLELTDLGVFKLVGLCAALTAITAVVAYGVIGLGRTTYDAVIVNNCYRLDGGTQYTEIFARAISQLDQAYFLNNNVVNELSI